MQRKAAGAVVHTTGPGLRVHPTLTSGDRLVPPEETTTASGVCRDVTSRPATAIDTITGDRTTRLDDSALRIHRLAWLRLTGMLD